MHCSYSFPKIDSLGILSFCYTQQQDPRYNLDKTESNDGYPVSFKHLIKMQSSGAKKWIDDGYCSQLNHARHSHSIGGFGVILATSCIQ